jgi:hypothetical protein
MTKESSRSLETQISSARQTIVSDGYPMSIGELTNLYKEGELVIRPEFQRFYRWTPEQKSNLVESILLGIPLPSIFVSQAETGKWELIDGLQRVSTILELQGELLDSEGEAVPALTLRSTKYLPSLDGCTWDGATSKTSLSEAQRLDIKRSKIDIKIIKRQSSAATKYDLFQRLNSYGSRLTPQEMRSALLVAVSPDFFAWIERLAANQYFSNALQLSDRLIEERYDLDLVLRFFVLHNKSESDLTQSNLRDFNQVLDDESVEMAKEFPRNRRHLQDVFEATFEYISNNGAENVFRKWDPARREFRGSFLNTAFEVFALGLGFHVANDTVFKKDLIGVVKDFWELPKMRQGFATGRSTESRLSEFVPLGRDLLKSRKRGL